MNDDDTLAAWDQLEQEQHHQQQLLTTGEST